MISEKSSLEKLQDIVNHMLEGVRFSLLLQVIVESFTRITFCLNQGI